MREYDHTGSGILCRCLPGTQHQPGGQAAAVCREHSINRAARQLYITPQGLSKALKTLEQELGARLLNRSSSGISLTDSGSYLQEHLEDFLKQYYSIRRGIQSISQRQNHEIDLLSAYGILRLVTPECIGEFKRLQM